MFRLRFVARLFLLLIAPTFAHAQAAPATETTVCDVLAAPQNFDGKIIKITGTVIQGFDIFAIENGDCHQPVNGIWLAYPAGTKAKSGPAAILYMKLAKNSSGESEARSRVPVSLDLNKSFRQFDDLLSAPAKSGGICLGCRRSSVKATFIGRLDGSSATGIQRDAAGKPIGIAGFGNLNAYRARLALQSVSDVTSTEIDYAKATQSESRNNGAAGDPVSSVQTAADAFPLGSPAARLERAAAAYGAPGEQNGVNVGFSGFNEIPADEGGKGQASSPDEVLYYCLFDMAALKGSPLTLAISHLGDHIYELRNEPQGASLAARETSAWQVTALKAIATKQKSLVLPGGFAAWDTSWARSDAEASLKAAISRFLSWAGL